LTDAKLIRTSKPNGYIFDATEYKAIGKDVPPDIAEFLSVTSDHFQPQHDYFYWFGYNGGKLVSVFNEIIDLSKIEQYCSTAKLKHRESDRQLK
jgi:hypothetical protein